MEEKKYGTCPECGGLNLGHGDRRCSLMTLEYAQQEIINVEQKWIKVVATMNKNKDIVFNRLKKLIHFNQGKAAILKAENNRLRKKIISAPLTQERADFIREANNRDPGGLAAGRDAIQRIKDFNLSDVDAPVFTHTKEFAAHFSYIKGKLMDIIKNP